MALSLAFFMFVMTGIIVCGQLVLAPASTTRGALVTLFRSIGEQFPGAHNEENKYRLQLAGLGYGGPSAVPVYYGIKFTSALLSSALVGLALVLVKGNMAGFVPALCGAGFGFLLPDRVLQARIRARTRRIRSGIPPALDVLLLGLESGQSLDHAIEYASRSLKSTHPDLSWELGHAYLDLRTRARADAFRNLAARNAEPELRKLSNLLIDSDRFGTSLGPALRTHARYLRVRFRQQAQERARKVGVKLIFPIFLLIFPSVLLVTLVPACLMMFQQLRLLLA